MTISAPRLLPATIVTIATLLGLKGMELVRAATPAEALGQPAAAHPTVALQPAPAAAAAPSVPPMSDSERTLLLDLRKRREELDSREQALRARESVLTAAEHKLDQRVAELQALQQRLEALEDARKQRQDANWAGLVKLYASMKPRDAAKIWNDLENQVLLELVDRMNERKAASILAAMQPDRAREITEKLAAMRLKRDNPGS
jgi:flagellar motility protein MotE (MotC chaperone)